MLVYPLTTEKIFQLASHGKYVFRVTPEANKVGIGQEVEKMYKVKVAKVNILPRKSKKRRLGRTQGVKKGFKKAIVTLQKDQKIEL